MKIVELDATLWTRALDFYDALALALGSPPEHGRGIDALIDSLVWGGMNEIEPPCVIRIRNIDDRPSNVIAEVDLAKQAIIEATQEYRIRKGRDVNVTIETVD